MKLGMFMMPVHPLHRKPSETMQEDRAAVILADELGFHDAFVGEHLTDQAENITNSLMFLSTLIHATKQIKLGSGTCNLTQMHPVLVAAQAAMFDQLAKGRFIFGISPGALDSDFEALSMLDIDRNKVFAESIDIILAIWERDPPYDIDLPNNRFKVSTKVHADADIGMGVMLKPFQSPRPEVVGTVVAPFSKGVIAMGERDFHPMSANFLMPQWIRSHWDNYAAGKAKAGASANPEDWRVARTLFVADDEKTAQAYVSNPNSPYQFYYKQLLTKLKKANRHGVFKDYRDQPDDQITLDHVVDRLVIRGSAESVAEQILELREQIGDFGELVYANMDWMDERLARRSLQLMAEEVIPRVNRSLSR